MDRRWVQEKNTNEGTKARQQQTSKIRAGLLNVKTSGLPSREYLITNHKCINDNGQFALIPLLLPCKIQPALTHYEAIVSVPQANKSRVQNTEHSSLFNNLFFFLQRTLRYNTQLKGTKEFQVSNTNKYIYIYF